MFSCRLCKKYLVLCIFTALDSLVGGLYRVHGKIKVPVRYVHKNCVTIDSRPSRYSDLSICPHDNTAFSFDTFPPLLLLCMPYITLLEKYPTLIFVLRKPGGFQWSSLAWGELRPSYLFPSVNSVRWQAGFEWISVYCSRRIFIVKRMTVSGLNLYTQDSSSVIKVGVMFMGSSMYYKTGYES